MVDAVVGSLPIDQPEAQPQSFSIDPSTSFNTPLPWNEDTGKAIAARAAKAAFGLSSKTGLTQDDYQKGLENGDETQLRQQAATAVDIERFKQNNINKVLTTTDPSQIAQMFKPSDPGSIFEKHYANEYMKRLDWPTEEFSSDRDTPTYGDMTGFAEQYDYVKQALGSPYLALKEYANTLRDNGRANIGAGNVISNMIVDFGSFGFYNEYQARRGGFIDPGVLLGSNIQEQSNRIFNIALTDFSRAKGILDDTYNKLYKFDPVAADNWLSGIIGQSQSDRQLNNIFTVANVLGGVTGLARPIRTAQEAAKVPGAFDRLLSSAKDMVRTTPDPSIPPKVAAPAMAGNVPESAVQKVVIDKINEFASKNDPVREQKERVASIYDMDGTAAAADPGRLGREMANRMTDIAESSKQTFIDRVFNAVRVNKTPAAVEIEANYRQIQKGLADENRGIDNSVLDISKPLYVEGSNNYMHNIALGTHDGDLFRSEDELRAMLKKNGLIVKGDLDESVPGNLRKSSNLTNLVKAYESAAKNAKTPEGVARAKAGAELIRQRIKDLPRHTEGVTIEHQGPTFNQYMDALDTPIEYPYGIKSKSMVLGPREPPGPGEKPIGAAKSTPDERTLSIVKQGEGYYANKIAYVPIEKSFVKDVLITTDINSGKEYRAARRSGDPSTAIPFFNRWFTGWKNGFFGRWHSPIGRLSITENQMRNVATVGPSVILGMLEDGHPLKIVPRADHEPFNRMLNFLQKDFNPETKGPGSWLLSPQQMEDWWQRYVGRNPDPNTEDAYFKYKARLVDDLNMRDLLVGQRKRERGIEQHNIKFTDSKGNKAQSGFFEGVKEFSVPYDGRRIAVINEDGKSRLFKRSEAIPSKLRGALDEDIKQGKAKLIHIADPKSRPLGDLNSNRIEYVVSYVNNYEEKSLPAGGHVNRMGGGHLQPEFPWFIKQAHVDEGVYEGDKTVLNFLTRAQAEEALPYLENVRQEFQKYRANAMGRTSRFENANREAIERLEGEGGLVPPDPLDAAVEANKKTGIPFHKHYDWYFGKNKYLDLNEPFAIVPADKKIMDMSKESAALKARHYKEEIDQVSGIKKEIHLVDGTRGQGSILGKTLTEFTQERDAEGIWTLRNKGTQQNPLFAYEPAPYLDPIVSMERGYSNIARSMWNEDMKDYSVAHWLEQAAPFLQTETTNTLRDLRANPLYHFHYPTYKNVPVDEKRFIWQLEANRKQALDFVGNPSEVDTVLRAWGQRMADSIYKTTGGKDRLSLTLMRDLPKMKSPIGFIRNMAFHPIMGLYAFPTFFTQASTFGNVMLMSPKQAAGAAVATLLYGYSKINRTAAIFDHMDSMASSMVMDGMVRFKPGQFQEATKFFEHTGFFNVGNEHAFASNQNQNVAQGVFKKVVDTGLLPFKAGAGFTRVGAGYAAYLEFRAENPFVEIGQKESRQILDRARLLDHNMSSAFSTKLHTGAMSIPMQFQAYDLRLHQMMFGPELTPAEKLRMFAGSFLLFGLAAGPATLAGFPIANYVKGKLADKMGYVPGESPSWDTLFQGIPSMLGKYLTGGGDYTKGTLYNTSRLGNKGLDPIEQALGGDKTLLDLAGGVVGGQWGHIWNDTWGLRQAFDGMVGLGPDYPLTLEDVLDGFNQITEVRDIRRTYAEFHVGKWITQNENRVKDITKASAILQHITGLSDVQGSNIWIKQQEIKEMQKDIVGYQALYAKVVRRMMQAILDNDPDNAKKYRIQSRAILEPHIPSDKWHETEMKAYESFNTDMQDKVNRELYLKLLGNIDMLQRIYKEEGGRQ